MYIFEHLLIYICGVLGGQLLFWTFQYKEKGNSTKLLITQILGGIVVIIESLCININRWDSLLSGFMGIIGCVVARIVSI